MSNNRIILVIKASDIDVSTLPEDKRDIKSRAFKDAVYSHLLKNYGGIQGEYPAAYPERHHNDRVEPPGKR